MIAPLLPTSSHVRCSELGDLCGEAFEGDCLEVQCQPQHLRESDREAKSGRFPSTTKAFDEPGDSLFDALDLVIGIGREIADDFPGCFDPHRLDVVCEIIVNLSQLRIRLRVVQTSLARRMDRDRLLRDRDVTVVCTFHSSHDC